MANNFKNATLNSDLAANTPSAALATVVGANTQTTIIGMTVSNIVSSVINVEISLVDSGGGITFIVKDAPIPTGGSLVISSDQKICMIVGNHIKVQSNTANSMNVIISYLEIT